MYCIVTGQREHVKCKVGLRNTVMCDGVALHTSHVEPVPLGLGQRALPLLTSQQVSLL